MFRAARQAQRALHRGGALAGRHVLQASGDGIEGVSHKVTVYQLASVDTTLRAYHFNAGNQFICPPS